MTAIHVANTVTIDHAKLGAEVWEWDAEQQADFLAHFARTFRSNGGDAIFQISFIADELRKEPWKIASLRWLNEYLTAYLNEEK